jgi:hypothetical protein
MTGPEHYRTAEDLLRSPGLDPQGIAEAQVHATLALAAATADLDDGYNWPEVIR